MKIQQSRSKGWSVDVTIGGERVRESGFATKGLLEDFVAELKLKARRRRYGLQVEPAAVLIEQLVEAQIATLGDDRNDQRGEKILRLFLAGFPSGAAVQDVRSSDLREFVKRLRRDSPRLKADSINRYLAFVSAMFKEAPSFFRELEEQDWRPPRFPWQKVSRRGRERVVTLEEREQLLQGLRFPGRQKYQRRQEKPDTLVTRRDVADALEVGFNTAMRPGEVRGLTWGQVDFRSGEIQLVKTKTNEPRVIPMNRRVVEILSRRKTVRSCSWVFPNREGNGPRGEISRVVRPIAKRLGLEYGRDLADGFTPHSQRHTATTEMLRRGHDLGTVKSITGHSDTTMALRYAHASHASRRRAVEDLVDADPAEENESHGRA